MSVYPFEMVRCPVCDAPTDSHGDVGKHDEDRAPEPGDYSLCVECLSFLRFTEEGVLALLTPDEIVNMDATCRRELMEARAFFRGLKRARERS